MIAKKIQRKKHTNQSKKIYNNKGKFGQARVLEK